MEKDNRLLSFVSFFFCFVWNDWKSMHSFVLPLNFCLIHTYMHTCISCIMLMGCCIILDFTLEPSANIERIHYNYV